MEDIIDIIVTETTNTIEITSQSTDEVIDVNIIDNREDITLNVTPTLVEININSLTGNFGVNWGEIEGTLSNQIDLQDALNLKADLVGGKVPSSQLPSYVDDVVEVANYAALPATGETGKIYVTIDTNYIYRWTGSVYVEIKDSSAVWGAITGTLSSQTDLQSALNAKQASLSGSGIVKSTSGTISYLTDNSTNWNTAYNDSIVSASVAGTTTKTLTLTQQDGGTVTASWTDINTDAVSSVFGRTGAVVAASGDYTTAQVTEATNLYYTDARARASVSGGTGISYNSTTGVITNTITQYTDALARAALSFTAGSGAYNSTTGVITIPTNTNQLTNGASFITLGSLSAGTGISYNSTTGVIASTITQYTDALARAAISGGTGISYNSTTGVITNTITQYTDALARAAISLTTTGTSGAATYNSTTGVLNIPQYQSVLTNPVTGTGTTDYLPKFTGASTIENSIFTENGGNTFRITAADAAVRLTGSTEYLLQTVDANGRFRIYDQTAAVERLTLTSGGNLGINTTSPLSILDIKGVGGSTGVTLTLENGGGVAALNDPMGIIDFYSNDPSAFSNGVFGRISVNNEFNGSWNGTQGRVATYMAFSTSANATLSEKMRLRSNGVFSIGNTNGTGSVLDIKPSDTTSNGIILSTTYNGTGSYGPLVFETSGGTRMTLNASGNLSIGNTNDTYKLDVNGTGRFTGDVTVGSSGSSNTLNLTSDTSTLRISGLGFSGSRNYGSLEFYNTDGSQAGPNVAAAIRVNSVQSDGSGGYLTFHTSLGTEAEGTPAPTRLTIDGAGAATFSSSVTAGGVISTSGAFGTSYGIYVSGTTYGTVGANRGASSASAGMNYYSLGTQKWFTGIYENTDNYGFYSVGYAGFPLTLNYTSGAATFSSSVTATNGFLRGDLGTGIDASLRLRNSNSTARTTRLQFEDYNGTIADAFLDFKIPTAGSSTGARLDIGVNSPALTILNGGNVGIGTTSPYSKLTIHSTASSTLGLNAQSGLVLGQGGVTNDLVQIGFNQAVSSTYSPAAISYLITNSGASTLGDILFSTRTSISDVAPSERMRITSGGNVGIGTTSPVDYTNYRSLHISGATSTSSAILYLTNSTSSIRGLFYVEGNQSRITIGSQSNHDLTLVSNDTERMRITSGGNVGIGTTSPGTKFTINNGYATTTTNYQFKNISVISGFSSGYGSSAIQSVLSAWDGGLYSTDLGYYYDGAGYGMTFSTNPTVTSSPPTERMRITSGGNVGIGTTNPNVRLKIIGESSTFQFALKLAKSSYSDTGGHTTLIGLGCEDAAWSRSAIGHTRTSSYDAGYLGFYVSNNNSDASELVASDLRMMINRNGNVGIGTSSPSFVTGGGLAVFSTSADTRIALKNTASGDASTDGFHLVLTTALEAVVENRENGSLRFLTNATEAARFTATQEFLIGLTSGNPGQNNTTTGCNFTGGGRFFLNNSGSDNIIGRNTDGIVISWRRAGVEVGTINVTSVSTTYNTTSDYRLKEDLKPIKGLEIVNKIKVYDYKWKSEDSRMNGVLAHELQEILPYAVTGVKDGDKMQSVDYSKIVPVMVQAIKDLKAELETIKNK